MIPESKTGRGGIAMRVWLGWLGVTCVMTLAGTARADVPEADKKLVDEVWARLVAVVNRPEGYSKWPPKCDIDDDKRVNAFATAEKEGKDDLVPVVVVSTGLLKQVIYIENKRDGEADRLAYVLG